MISKSVTKAVNINELVKLECKDSLLNNRERRMENSFCEYVVILYKVLCDNQP